MTTLKIYFDETGHGDDPNIKFFGIVGCLARDEQWIEFETEWNSALKAESLDYFHMSDFAHSTKNFKDWKGDNQRRAQFEIKLWEIIHKIKPVLIGCFVDLEGYRGALGKVCRDNIGDVYFFAYLHCIKVISVLVRNQSMSNFSIDKIATIFDNKKGFIGKSINIYEKIINRFPDLKEIIPSPVFRDMRKVNPIQAADIIAYEVHKEFKENLKGNGRAKKRFGFEQLEILFSEQNESDFDFGDPNSAFAFYSQNELAKIAATYQMRVQNGY